MERFVAFDVETPNRYNNRMSAIGISVIENRIIKDRFYSLVDPETSFDPFNVRLTGISENSVSGAPSFDELWPNIRGIMDSGILVAHNAQFDLCVLKKCLLSYGIYWKDSAKYLCTVNVGRKILPDISHRLDNLCQYYSIPLDHHHAGSDSDACAYILLRYLQKEKDIGRYIKEYRFV